MTFRNKLLLILALCALFVWVYGPTISDLRAVWDREPDYSHGYLVIPMAVGLAVMRRRSCPASDGAVAWKGFLVIAAACCMKVAGHLLFLNFLDGWSMPVWIIGCIWIFFGGRSALWAAPAFGFLFFAVPLPFRVEQLFSLPLQRVATIWSSWVLQCLSLPAIAEGNTILLGNSRLEVQQACSGLRTISGMIALAYVLCVLLPRPWWKKALLVCCTLPVAMISNTLRIVATGLVIYGTDDVAWHNSAHDWSGRLMIPVAACLFFLLVWYFDRLWLEVSNNALVKIERDRMNTRLAPRVASSQTTPT